MRGRPCQTQTGYHPILGPSTRAMFQSVHAGSGQVDRTAFTGIEATKRARATLLLS
jgi:hypothetical protein